ncbi:MAG TPA: ABC transporter ATP-binding protein [Burkholderiales bacterium]|nr:ABC transporter ATP-binding protein [Burkholderiales bacterium]
MLEVSDLHAGYGALRILRGIDMRIEAREIVAVLGANGVGKTTLNNTLSGLIRPAQGSIRFLEESIGGRAAERIVASGLVQVPEGRRIFPNLTVRENLELGSYRRAKANRQRNLEQVMTWFPRLKERSSQYAGTLSGGEQQMLATGRGLMSEPKLLILDEPSLGLSPLMVDEMFSMIRRINSEGVTVLLVEQNVVQSLNIAHRAYVLENGAFTLSGRAAELVNDPRLKQAYLGL